MLEENDRECRKKKKKKKLQAKSKTLSIHKGWWINRGRVILFRYCSASCAADLNEVQIPRDKVQ